MSPSICVTGEPYYRARYYDPQIGRFNSEDPKRFQADVNFYAYVKNSAPNMSDPLGLQGGAYEYVCTRQKEKPLCGVCFYGCLRPGVNPWHVWEGSAGLAQITISKIRRKCPGPPDRCPYIVNITTNDPNLELDVRVESCEESPTKQ